MIKETWTQFSERVKPDYGAVFEDDFGFFWRYRKDEKENEWFVHIGTRYVVDLKIEGIPGIGGRILPCSLVDAIENIE